MGKAPCGLVLGGAGQQAAADQAQVLMGQAGIGQGHDGVMGESWEPGPEGLGEAAAGREVAGLAVGDQPGRGAGRQETGR